MRRCVTVPLCGTLHVGGLAEYMIDSAPHVVTERFEASACSEPSS